MNNSVRFLDIETINQNTFKRSKAWATFLNNINDDEQEVHIADFEKLFPEEIEKNDDANLDSSLEAEEDDVFDDEEVLLDITNRSLALIQQSKNRTLALVHYGAPNKDCNELLHGETDDAETRALQDEDVLNQTRPILAEHERQWKEAGIDRILNTFDVQKIEEKVGSWMRRNHSNTSVLPLATCRTPLNAVKRKERRLPDAESDSDSLQSVDTARYIRSSRKRQGTGSSSCTTMTIKTFRLVQSKREALREKLACHDHRDEAHLDELLVRRRAAQLLKQQRCCKAMATTELQLSAESRRKQRRRHRSNHSNRKRVGMSVAPSSLTDSSDCSLSTDETCCSQPNAVDMPRKSRNIGSLRCASKQRPRRRIISRERKCVRFCSSHCSHGRAYRNQHHSFSSSSSSYLSSHSLSQNFGYNLKMLRRHGGLTIKDIEADTRPCKLESECCCYKEDKLCKGIRHLADNSTEEWLVENSYSPTISLPSSRIQQTPTAKASIKTPFMKADLAHNQQPTKSHAKQETITASTEIIKKKSNTKHQEQHKNDNITITSGESEESQSEPIKTKQAKTKTLRRSYKKKSNVKASVNCQSLPLSLSDEELQRAIEISKESFKMEKQKREQKEKQHKKVKEIKTQLKTKQAKIQNISKKLIISKPEPEPQSLLFDEPKLHSKVVEEIEIQEKPRQLECNMLSEKTIIDEQKPQISLLEEQNKIETPERTLKPRPKSVKIRHLAKISEDKSQSSTIDTAEDTFFNNASKICNSTALCNNDTATTRQFSRSTNSSINQTSSSTAVVPERISKRRGKPAVKRTSAVSSTQQTSTGSTSSVSGMSTQSSDSPVFVKTINNNDNDCTVVSSTTDECEKGILVYEPNNKSLAPDGRFFITEEHLSTIIGAALASKFFKCWHGRRWFDGSSTIYFKPPKEQVSDSDSDDDELDLMGHYGELHESKQKIDHN